MHGFYKFCKGMLYFPYKIVYPVKVVGCENIPQDVNYISVSNHLRWTDTPTVGINIKGYRHFLAKKEIADNKFVHWLADRLGVIFIERGAADLAAVKRVLKALKAGENLAVFPEGTRNRVDTSLQEIKSGAAMFAIKSGVTVVPMMIYAKSKAFRKNYLYVAPAVDLSRFAGRRLDAESLDEAVEILSAHMREAKDYLDDYVINKRWKELRAAAKVQKKRLKNEKKRMKKERGESA